MKIVEVMMIWTLGDRVHLESLQKVQLGKILAPVALTKGWNWHELNRALQKHALGDWGSMGITEWQQVDDALEAGRAVYSAHARERVVYSTERQEYFIVTKWDRTVTRVFFGGAADRALIVAGFDKEVK